MSFLSKLGDFAGGFAEGLGESLPRALEAGLDRRIDLMDEERKWARQDAIREQTWAREESRAEENRQLAIDKELLQGQINSGDIEGLSARSPDDPLYSLAQSGIANIVDTAEANTLKTVRMVELVKSKVGTRWLGNNDRDLHFEGAEPQHINDDIDEINNLKASVNELLTNPMYFQSLSEVQRESLTNELANLDALVVSLDSKRQSLGTYLHGKEANNKTLDSLISFGDTESAAVLATQMFENKQIGLPRYRAITQAINVTALRHALSMNDTERAYAIVGGANESDRMYLEKVLDADESAKAGDFSQQVLQNTGFSRLPGVMTLIKENPDLTDHQKKLQLQAARDMSDKMGESVLPRVAAAREKAREDVAKQAGAAVYDAPRLEAAVDRHLRRYADRYGVSNWEIDRYEMMVNLRQEYDRHQTVSASLIQHLSLFVKVGVISKEEAVAQLDANSSLTIREREEAKAGVEAMTVGQPTAGQQYSASILREFTLQDITDAASQWDEEFVKREMLKARSQGVDVMNAVGEKLIAEIKNQVGHRGITEEEFLAAEDRIRLLMGALSESIERENLESTFQSQGPPVPAAISAAAINAPTPKPSPQKPGASRRSRQNPKGNRTSATARTFMQGGGTQQRPSDRNLLGQGS